MTTHRPEQTTETPNPAAVPTPAASAILTHSASAAPSTSSSFTVAWQEPAAYTFTIESSCGERAFIGRFHVQVENGRTVNVEALSGYGGSMPFPASAVPTLDDLLGLAASARSQNADEVSVLLDPVDGHPTFVSVDWRAEAIDDEECYRITDYSPKPAATPVNSLIPAPTPTVVLTVAKVWRVACINVIEPDCRGIARLFANNLAWSYSAVLAQSDGQLKVEVRPDCPDELPEYVVESPCWQATASGRVRDYCMVMARHKEAAAGTFEFSQIGGSRFGSLLPIIQPPCV